MSFRKFVRAFAPVAAVGLAALLSGCDDADVSIDGEKGKPLSEIDLTGPAPKGVVLAAPDELRLRQGDALAITVDGAPEITEALRFTLKDGTLGIMRKKGTWSDDAGKAIVNVTMPAPETVVAAGSGKIQAEALAGKAKVTIAGSGDIETMNVAAEALDVTIAGSGTYRAAGAASALDLTIAGSGDAQMDALKADGANITIAGSGRAGFASDGSVKASIVGSGEVRVHGRAKCEVKAAGSGRLVCDEPAKPAAD